MRALRSVLFVPGHKADWIQKALASPADGIIIDLEDAVPEADKALARENARAAISEYPGDKTVLVPGQRPRDAALRGGCARGRCRRHRRAAPAHAPSP
ncbi:hypothetical protein QF046_002795 [Microbacterium sp. W4I4]|nr:hypothetical protein [Microbacterium sp. W4I4]